ncbi:uncharacterized protein METZ01_LOCUS503800, partial [marine metagenome]
MGSKVTVASVLDLVTRGVNLSESESGYMMEEIMTGRATSAQIAGLLVALKMKGESVEEIVGMAGIMRSHSVKLSRPIPDCFDTCGTGGDGAR